MLLISVHLVSDSPRMSRIILFTSKIKSSNCPGCQYFYISHANFRHLFLPFKQVLSAYTLSKKCEMHSSLHSALFIKEVVSSPICFTCISPQGQEIPVWLFLFCVVSIAIFMIVHVEVRIASMEACNVPYHVLNKSSVRHTLCSFALPASGLHRCLRLVQHPSLTALGMDIPCCKI